MHRDGPLGLEHPYRLGPIKWSHGEIVPDREEGQIDGIAPTEKLHLHR